MYPLRDGLRGQIPDLFQIRHFPCHIFRS